MRQKPQLHCESVSVWLLSLTMPRRTLSKLLNKRSKIDAYCIDCNVCWPISEGERRRIASKIEHHATDTQWCRVGPYR